MAKFLRRGTAKVFWLPTVAGTGAPSAAEVTSGVDLSARVADLAGWALESAPIDTPDLSSRFVTTIPGEQTVGASTITYYADDAATDAIKTAQPIDQIGFIYIMHQGQVAGRKADLFPVRVSSIGNEFSMGNDAARYVINYAVTGAPRIDVTIA